MAKTVKTLDGLREAIMPLLRESEFLSLTEHVYASVSHGAERVGREFTAGVVVRDFNRHVAGHSAQECLRKFLVEILPSLRPKPAEGVLEPEAVTRPAAYSEADPATGRITHRPAAMAQRPIGFSGVSGDG